MDIAPPSPKPRAENITPMINVVFLLLIFFLMTAQIAPPAPFEVVLPDAGSDQPAEGPFTLHLGADGRLGFLDAIGEDAALDALEHAYTRACADHGCFGAANQPVVILRADGEAEAQKLPELLRKLASRRITNIQLATRLATPEAK